MKLNTKVENVLGSSGLEQSKGFQMRASAHAFKMLSSGLYSDKIMAVLREIGCNAVDAHIAQSTPTKPIRVKIPNAVDGQFYVQDWGPGLSHEAATGLYSTYFESTKQTSNDQTGAFGLGSKSPFSYTDSYTVVSVHGGKKRTYALYLDNNGLPTVSLMTEEEADADWQHGLRVAFAVRPEDFNEFAMKAQLVFQWFKVPPEMKGVVPISKVEYEYECPEFGLRKTSGLEGGIVMGGVHYPFVVGEVFKGQQGDVELWGGLSSPVLFVPIGTVQVVASREQIEYNKESVAVLRELARKVLKHVAGHMRDSLRKHASMNWTDLCSAEALRDHIWKSWTISGLLTAYGDCADSKEIKDLNELYSRSEIELPKTAGVKAGCRVVKHSPPRVYRVMKGSLAEHSGVPMRLELLADTVIAYGDENYAPSRAKRALLENKYKQIIVVCKDKFHKPTAKDLLHEAQAISDGLRGMPIIELGTLPPPDIVAAPKPGRTPAGRKSKKWIPSLPTGVQFTHHLLDGTTESQELDQKYPTFMVRADKNRWGSTTRRYRVLGTTLKDDLIFEADWWHSIWHTYSALQEHLGVKGAPRKYAVLTAQEAKSIALLQLGWTPTHALLKQYISGPEVNAAIKKLLLTWQPEAPDAAYNNGWMSDLSSCYADNELPPTVIKALNDVGLLVVLRGMVDARKQTAPRKKAAEILRLYNELCSHLRTPTDGSLKMEQSITIEEMDASFRHRFPIANMLDIRQVMEGFAGTEEEIKYSTKLLTAVLSMEIKQP